jgi:hypothetical protein
MLNCYRGLVFVDKCCINCCSVFSVIVVFLLLFFSNRYSRKSNPAYQPGSNFFFNLSGGYGQGGWDPSGGYGGGYDYSGYGQAGAGAYGQPDPYGQQYNTGMQRDHFTKWS